MPLILEYNQHIVFYKLEGKHEEEGIVHCI